MSIGKDTDEPRGRGAPRATWKGTRWHTERHRCTNRPPPTKREVASASRTRKSQVSGRNLPFELEPTRPTGFRPKFALLRARTSNHLRVTACVQHGLISSGRWAHRERGIRAWTHARTGGRERTHTHQQSAWISTQAAQSTPHERVAAWRHTRDGVARTPAAQANVERAIGVQRERRRRGSDDHPTRAKTPSALERG